MPDPDPIDPHDTPEFALDKYQRSALRDYGQHGGITLAHWDPDIHAAVKRYDQLWEIEGGPAYEQLADAADELRSLLAESRRPVAVRPGDYLGVMTRRPLSTAEIHSMQERLEEHWPDIQVVIFQDIDDLVVLRPETQPADPHDG